jgi:tellurite resistance protein
MIGALHIVTAASLKRLVRCEDGEKLTAAQLRRLGETAAVLGFAIEPDPRLLGRAVSDEAEFALWRSANTACPEREVYQAAAGLLSLGLSIALADGVATEKELEVVSQLVNELVPIDDLLKQRLDALRTVLVRQPDRLATAARKLQNSRTPAERAKIGRVLVLVAAADGLLGIEEHKALRAVYRALGLTGADLDATLVECELRLSSDATVLADAGVASQGGEAIPRPPEARAPAPAGVTLDHAAIASIMAETREVASMLAAVLGGDDEDEAPPVAAATPVSASERPPAAALPPDLQALAASLDPRYHLALRELVTKPAWNAAEVRDLGVKLKLMPGGIIEAINSWSDEHLGDYLIDEQDDWHIRVEILKRPHA